MKITVRLIVSIVTVIMAVVTASTLFQSRQEKRNLMVEMTRRSSNLAAGLEEIIAPALLEPKKKTLNRIAEKFGNRENIFGVGIYDAAGSPLAVTQKAVMFEPEFQPIIKRALTEGSERSELWHGQDGLWIHVYASPATLPDGSSFAMAVFQNANSINQRIVSLWTHGFLRLLIYAFLISLTTIFIIRWNIMSPLHKAAEWIKNLRLGQFDDAPAHLPSEIFGPLAREVSHMATSLSSARLAAEEEARLRQTAEALWTPERLKEHSRTKLGQRPLFVIANREPYMHTRKGKAIECVTPASGLVTAIEPILRACGGTWIAHGAGDADRETVDSTDKVRVPPDEPQYALRRIWLSKEEENGYYYGFSNEGLWPLCHIAHTRPLFKASDWEAYRAVNEKFAKAALEEMKDTENPCVLIQDYHFALLPRLIKEKRPDARVGLFWHIPWPNPESFSICPWRKELLHGMLGADLVGFHIQYHCNNFLETVDRVLECRIDRERYTIDRQGHTSWIKPFPISITMPTVGKSETGTAESASRKDLILKDLGVKADILAVGVDRIDYTKGIVERFRGIERFLEKFPEYQSRYTFIELGAPSRTLIKRYHDLIGEVEAEADRINWRFKTKDWKPVVFLKKHHSHAEIEPFYKAADMCLVTSLHDGMNLVAKEYVAIHGDKDGALILSHFAGASRELRDALIVNPYDIEQIADAIRFAIEMPPAERAARMNRMWKTIQEKNIYRWGADLIGELTQIRITAPELTRP